MELALFMLIITGPLQPHDPFIPLHIPDFEAALWYSGKKQHL